MACFCTAPAIAGKFYEYGPIGCSSEWPISQEYGGKSIIISVDLPDGSTRRFKAVGTSHELSKRKLPVRSSFRFGPQKIIDCSVDTSQITGASCRDYPTRRGWGGSCEYCTIEKDGVERCHYIRGQLIEIPRERRARQESAAIP